MSQRRPMIGNLVAFVIFVDGPAGSSAVFSEDEKVTVLRECYRAGGLLRRLGEGWGRAQTPPVASPCGFTVLSRSVRIALDPEPLRALPPEYDARTKPWLTAAFQALKFPGIENIRLREGLIAGTYLGLGAADAFPVFVTKYPHQNRPEPKLKDKALAAFCDGNGMVVLWVPVLRDEQRLFADLDGVIAHEIGHVFGNTDEYDPCSQTTHHGFFPETLNANCVVPLDPNGPKPSAGHQPCLMEKSRAHVACPTTIEAWGWVDSDHDGVADLGAPATIELPRRDADQGQLFTVKGRNLWDARAVFFGDKVASFPGQVEPLDEVTVEVPKDASGILTVSVLTRAGLATGPFDETWVIAGPKNPTPAPPGPRVIGVIPNTGSPGDSARVVGVDLARPTAVTFGDVPVPNLDPFEAGTASELSVTVPPHTAGKVTVTVTNALGTSTTFPPFSDFTYR